MHRDLDCGDCEDWNAKVIWAQFFEEDQLGKTSKNEHFLGEDDSS